MIVETGHYALVLALALALVNSVLPVWGSVTRDQRLMAVAPAAALIGFGLVAYAYFALTWPTWSPISHLSMSSRTRIPPNP
jgi:cytochrome c-type biogenesis protein CcmF